MSQNLETTYNPKAIEDKLYKEVFSRRSRQKQEAIYHCYAAAEYHR